MAGDSDWCVDAGDHVVRDGRCGGGSGDACAGCERLRGTSEAIAVVMPAQAGIQ